MQLDETDREAAHNAVSGVPDFTSIGFRSKDS